MPSKRDQLVEAARAYLGTRWRHQGRSINGMDCAGLIVCSLKDVGILVPDRTDYQRRTFGTEFMAHFKEHGRRKRADEGLLPGDVGLFREPMFPCHCAIFSMKHGLLHIIHGHARRRKVIEEPYAHEWLNRFVAAFAVPALEE